ncbi:ABC transporter ATP-binding protein [Prosthecomicrobium sp. N25]|uniref:ABC transporter ATP-binding protein n=1 Tax=Prosthecomicrobium sp. N25 TaxID=3129254 RepID=UPI0030778552
MDLIARGIRHGYEGLTVLDDVTLEVASGEIVAVIGPSGCGKSTLLRILGGLERPDGGAVLTRGAVPKGTLNPLTYVFQDFALVPWRSVAGNVALPLEHHRLAPGERERRVADALARVGLSDFAGALPRQLSGGMRQRTAIARALAVDPAVLLMDEPLSALDAQTRELLMDDLLRLSAASGFTAVYVTHNIAEAVRLGHRVVVLSRRPGRIREVVEIGVPLGERRDDHPAVAAARDRLWALIRDEAAAADREVVHG